MTGAALREFALGVGLWVLVVGTSIGVVLLIVRAALGRP